MKQMGGRDSEIKLINFGSNAGFARRRDHTSRVPREKS